MLGAIRRTLAELQKPASALLRRLARVTGVEAGAFGFRFGFDLDSVGAEGGPTLARALTELVDQAGTDVVLIVDEVQHALTSEEGNRMLLALKAARDAINPRPGTPGHWDGPEEAPAFRPGRNRGTPEPGAPGCFFKQ